MNSFRLLIFSLALFGAAQAQSNPKIVPVSFGKMYVPQGYDSNDNVQLVGTGVYPNSCYRNADTKVVVDHKKKTVRLQPMSYHYEGMCLQVILPFDRVVDLGILKNGDYKILQGDSEFVIGSVGVAPTVTKNPDDYLYAPISQAYIQNENGVTKLLLSGEFPTSCMQLKEVRSQVANEVLVVQPISETVADTVCTPGQYHFEVKADVAAMKPGRYLLHVRSMNGKSVNNFFEVR
jgi:hypothetical protein